MNSLPQLQSFQACADTEGMSESPPPVPPKFHGGSATPDMKVEVTPPPIPPKLNRK